jgi:hypothetical protein
MAKFGTYLHSVTNDSDIAAVGTAYNLAKFHSIQLQAAGGMNMQGQPYKNFLRSMIIKAKSLAGGAAKVTFRLCSDATGDTCVVGDTEVVFDLGITTVTEGTAQILFDDYPFFEEDDTIFVFYKVDAGTATIDFAQINWSE